MVLFYSEPEASLSTTRPLHEKEKKRIPVSAADSFGYDRRVRFAENNQEYDIPQQHLGIPASTLWYGSGDFASFKESIKIDVKRIARNCKKAFVQVHKMCQTESYLDQALVLGAFRTLNLEVEEFSGLERLMSREIYSDKRHRRSLSFGVVDALQLTDFCDNELRDASMRYECERISRPSVLFAQCVATIAQLC